MHWQEDDEEEQIPDSFLNFVVETLEELESFKEVSEDATMF